MSQSRIEYTDLGPVAPDSADVLQAQQDIWQAAFDNKPNPDPATPQGQLMASLAAIVPDKNSQLLFLANMFNPATSQGVYQDAIAAIYFITRQTAQATTVQMVSVLFSVAIAVLLTSARSIWQLPVTYVLMYQAAWSALSIAVCALKQHN